MTPTLPRITIITPSYNQGRFLTECIESVLGQRYPDVEYMVIDGGSDDGSADIIERYRHRLAYAVSERDRGQAHAINKGLSRASGELWMYLCADDALTPGALDAVAQAFASNPRADVVYGNCTFIDKYGRDIGDGRVQPFDRERLLRANYIYQPSTFLRTRVSTEHGLLDESLHYVLDYEYWIRLSQHATFQHVPHVLSRYRVHAATKSAQGNAMALECRGVRVRYGMSEFADWRYRKYRRQGRLKFALRRLILHIKVELRHWWLTRTG